MEKMIALSQGSVKTTSEIPSMEIDISNVSHTDAVKTLGIACKKCFCDAPWLKIKMFCTPSGIINPKAKTIPYMKTFICISISLLFYGK